MASQLTQIFQPVDTDIRQAAKCLRDGGLIAFPTETVYGLGANAIDDTAIAMIYDAKGRPKFNPLIVHFASLSELKAHVDWNEAAEDLAQAFWPGPLTLVLQKNVDSPISPLVSAGLDTLAVRLPAHPLAQQFLKAAGVPVAAPSANRSGKMSPTSAAHVHAGLQGRIAGILDGGDCKVGLESTILDLSTGSANLLRHGGVPLEDIEALLGREVGKTQTVPQQIKAPGQLASHYAPRAKLRLNAADVSTGECYLGFGQMECDLNLSSSGDLIEAAANLFRHLHALDAFYPKPIAVAPIPNTGLGRAINDRLRRAAAPRPTS